MGSWEEEVIAWMKECCDWHYDQSRITESPYCKMHMYSAMAYRRCMEAVKTCKPGVLPIGLEIRRDILFRKFPPISR